MRVLTALGASISSHLFHEPVKINTIKLKKRRVIFIYLLVHKRIFIVLLDHPGHSILKEVDLQFTVRVHLIVHVEFLGRIYCVILV